MNYLIPALLLLFIFGGTGTLICLARANKLDTPKPENGKEEGEC